MFLLEEGKKETRTSTVASIRNEVGRGIEGVLQETFFFSLFFLDGFQRMEMKSKGTATGQGGTRNL